MVARNLPCECRNHGSGRGESAPCGGVSILTTSNALRVDGSYSAGQTTRNSDRTSNGRSDNAGSCYRIRPRRRPWWSEPGTALVGRGTPRTAGRPLITHPHDPVPRGLPRTPDDGSPERRPIRPTNRDPTASPRRPDRRAVRLVSMCVGDEHMTERYLHAAIRVLAAAGDRQSVATYMAHLAVRHLKVGGPQEALSLLRAAQAGEPNPTPILAATVRAPPGRPRRTGPLRPLGRAPALDRASVSWIPGPRAG